LVLWNGHSKPKFKSEALPLFEQPVLVTTICDGMKYLQHNYQK
jgi:hypothetical protein